MGQMKEGWVILGLAGAAAIAYMARPSKHFSWAELTTTNTGLPNNPNLMQAYRLKILALSILEPIRAQFGPTRVNSAFRSTEVNTAVGGSKTSAHMYGEAADLEWDDYSADDVAAWLYEQTDLPLDQVIVERHTGHLHIGMGGRREFLETSDGKSYSAWAGESLLT